jgi:hypothetical protein
MKYTKFLLIPILAVLIQGCTAPTSSNPEVVALENPNADAKVAQAVLTIAAQRFLGNNPSYKNELTAAADALVVLANGNPSLLTGADVAAALAKTGLSSAVQNEVSGDVTTGLDLFNVTFAIKFPSVKVNYAIFLDSAANALYAATGSSQAVTLPVIPWPPVTAAATAPALGPIPTPTPTPAPTS